MRKVENSGPKKPATGSKPAGTSKSMSCVSEPEIRPVLVPRPMGREFSVFIPHEFPSRNKLENISRANKFFGAAFKKKYTKLAEMFIRDKVPRGWVPLQRYRIYLRWVCKDERQDPDNVLSGGIKPVMDGMVDAGLVAGDRWKNVESIETSFSVDRVNPGVLVIVEGT